MQVHEARNGSTELAICHPLRITVPASKRLMALRSSDCAPDSAPPVGGLTVPIHQYSSGSPICDPMLDRIDGRTFRRRRGAIRSASCLTHPTRTRTACRTSHSALLNWKIVGAAFESWPWWSVQGCCRVAGKPPRLVSYVDPDRGRRVELGASRQATLAHAGREVLVAAPTALNA